jgi:hypothetical protein
MRHVSFLLLSFLLLAACAPTSAEVTRARSAEYDPREFAAVYEACKATMVESGYDIAGEDMQHGILVSSWRWYSKEGTAKRKEAPQVENGAAMFRVGVELAKGPHGGVIVHVDGGAQGYSTGSPVARAFKHDDPEEPTWVEGKIDNLTVGISQKIAQYQLKEGTPGVVAPAPNAAPAPGPQLPETPVPAHGQ